MEYVHCSYQGDYVYEFAINPDDIAKSPQWPDSEKHPPLSPRDAINEAQRAILRLFPDIRSDFVKFRDCSLKNLTSSHWYYLITFSIPDGDPFVDDGSFDIPVLFNGQAVSPQKKEDLDS